MEDDLITTKEVGDYRIKVYYCHDSECPITNWGLFGSFFFEYSDMERFTLILTDEERSLVEERIKSGYYFAENIEKRKIEAHKADVAGKRFNICEYYNQKIREAETNKKIMLCVFDYGLPINNVIYYPHSNTLSFNWNDYGGKITQEEFDDFVNNVDRSQLPEGIKFELK